jgi:hypothetical protein
MTQSGSYRPVRIRFTLEADRGWCFGGLEGAAIQLREELAGKLLDEIKVAELPEAEAVVGHVRAAGSWFIFFKPSGEQGLTGVILPDDVYQRHGYDPYRIGAAVLGRRTLAVIVAPAGTQPAEEQALGTQLASAYRQFRAGDPGSPLPCYSSHGVPAEVPAEPRWQEVPLLRTDKPETPEAGLEEMPTPTQDIGPAALRKLEQRLGDVEESLRLRTRMLAATLAVAVVMPMLVGFMVWSSLQGDVQRLEETKVATATLMDGLLLGGDQQDTGLSREDALMAKLHDLATVSVQSGAWQTGLRQREVDPGELLDTLVTIMQTRTSLAGLARVERPLRNLAGIEPVLSRLAPRTEPLLKLAGNEEPLTRLSGSADQLAALAEHSESLSRVAGHEPAVSALAAVHEPLTEIAELQPGLSQLHRRQADLVALAGHRSEIETQLRTAATLDTMINEMSRVLTFMEQRQADLEQLARRKDIIIQLAGLRDELTSLARKHKTLDQLAGSGDALLKLGNNIYLQRMADNDKALAVLSSRLDALAQLTLSSDQLLQLIGTSGPT